MSQRLRNYQSFIENDTSFDSNFFLAGVPNLVGYSQSLPNGRRRVNHISRLSLNSMINVDRFCEPYLKSLRLHRG